MKITIIAGLILLLCFFIYKKFFYKPYHFNDEDEMLKWVVQEAWNTGKAVTVNVDDNGNAKVTYSDINKE
jgi:hypothetical protein